MAVKKPDPLFDLILDEDLAHNTWPKKMAAIKAAGMSLLSGCMMCACTDCPSYLDKKSLMSTAMSEELFNKLKDIKSPKVPLHQHARYSE